MKWLRRSAYRRTAMAGVAVVATAAVTLAVTSPGSAESSFTPGLGTAIALVYKVNPIFGNLSFGITAGESVAGHQNTAATAQSKAINLGVIGVTLAAEGCDGADPTLPNEQQPQPVIVSSDDQGAAQGKTATEAGAISMSAKATKQPYAEAITTVAPLGDPTGVLINGGTSTASSGVTKAGVRTARADSQIARVSLFGGLITLDSLRWTAVQSTGGETTSAGKFTMGGIHVAGTNIPLPDNTLDQLNALHDVLGSLGVTIIPPASRVANGIVFVDPLRIGIVPSTLRDTLMQAVLGGIQPVREALTQFLASISCDSQNDILGNNGKTAVTILDLALGSISGAGELTVELGGVQATTSELSTFGGLGVVPALPSLTTPLGNVSVGNLPDLSGTTPNVGGSTNTGQGTNPAAAKPIAEVDGDRGGILLGVAGGGLLLLLLTAEADRRKMRRAQREILQEA